MRKSFRAVVGLPAASALLAAVLAGGSPARAESDRGGGPILEAREGAPFVGKALPLGLAGLDREALVTIAEGGEGVVIYLPEGKRDFSLNLLPGLGSNLSGLAVADADGDGMLDLVLEGPSGDVSLWRGDGRGRFIEPDWAPKLTHHGVHPHANPPAPAPGDHGGTERGAPSHEDVLSRETLRLRAILARAASRAARASAAAANAPLPAGELEIPSAGGRGEIASATVADLDADGAEDLVEVTPAGAMLVFLGDGRGGLQAPHVYPLEIRPRHVVAGRFTAGGRIDLAVVGAGPRPPLLVFENLGRAESLAPVARSSSWHGPSGEISAGLAFAARVVSANFATVTVNVGQSGLTFSPSAVNAQAGDTVSWVWSTSFHTVTSGTSCTADNLFCSPNNTNCATAPTSNAGAVYQRVFPTSGSFPYFCRPHCASGMTGIVNVVSPAPGRVPDGVYVPGTQLTIAKAGGGNVTLTWGPSCSPDANDYAVYEGSLPIAGVYSHVPRSCALGNVTTTSLTPSAGDRYYLIVPQTSVNEGSYGRASSGAERPQLGGFCRAQLLQNCP